MQREPDERPFVKDQELLNEIFKAFRLSFHKPNRITISLTAMKRSFSQTSQPASSTLSQEEWNTARDITRDLWGILEEISGLRTHRHRVDARNIMVEVQNRLQGLPATIVEPCPQFLPYIGPMSSSNGLPKASSLTLEELEGIKAERLTGQARFPVPEGSQPKFIDRENDNLSEENTALSQLIMAQLHSAPDALETLRQVGAANPGSPTPTYLDDPIESLIYYSSNFPLLVGPYPRISVPPETVVHPTVYDLRKCAKTHEQQKPENPDSYIFKLVCRVQDTVLQPEVIFKYTIITRATRDRFQGPSTDDDIENEPPATEEEVTYLIEWISKGFPKIFVRHSPAQSLLICGEHDRNRDPTSIELNGAQFDAIEQSQREGKSPIHLIYQIYVTLFHELAHYLNTQINAPNNKNYLTPRKLRWELKPEGFTEYPEHPRHNVFSPYMGEVGQLVEFLVFGYMVGVIPGLDRDKLFARAWGTGSESGAVVLPKEVVGHMLASRVPRWMDGPMLRELVRGYELQRESNFLEKKAEGDTGTCGH
ncbi:hypothetical protein B9Z19DRAFT_1118619 [Tuber borchii]|uniref:Uncharacterized protein n=1 Tax=Tuber borchii TaxID=42251 RepID=A0A2T7A841_TUBBO|nr:hypothetical protein B9Z19DRAFT_1118619 [Tuber borchii]